MALVSLHRAKQHLRVMTVDDDAAIAAAVDQASALVLSHVKTLAVAGWSTGTVAVPGACLLYTSDAADE